ncbi:MAG: helicase-related protein [Planctomycetota bacterium]|nr:helicase-related protein [Planctomycetota bacterium]
MDDQGGTGLGLASRLVELDGIGPVKAKKYHVSFGAEVVEDLFKVIPKKYSLAPQSITGQHWPDFEDQQVAVGGLIYSVSVLRFGGRRNVLNVRIEVDGEKLCIQFFNQGFRKKQFVTGACLFVEGRLIKKNGWCIYSPQVVDPPGDGEQDLRPRPQYPKADGLPPKVIAKSLAQALPLAAELDDPLPLDILQQAKLPSLADAVRMIHLPSSLEEAELGRRRLALGELFSVHKSRAANVEEIKGIECSDEIRQRILQLLPFDLNEEQSQVVDDLAVDLASGKVMRRLLHGEVGSGKTAVAFVLALMVVAAGGQVAVLAPTDILARQHYDTFNQWLQATDTKLSFNRSGGHIVIGTHALFGDKVEFNNLQLVILDEQQRFGVEQKRDLINKGRHPHVLTMTATPIPRTLAWSYFGALRPCHLQKRAGANAEIETKVFHEAVIEDQCTKLVPLLEKGQQILIVVPRIDGQEGLLWWHEYLMNGIFKPYKSALVHGRLDSQLANQALGSFRNRNSQILFATTIIEVGLDIAGLQHLMVFSAQRLGLSSLHQLRGRLARGANSATGYCQFFVDGDEAIERISALEQCTNGFEVAAADLKQRGPGALLGNQQSGFGHFQCFDPLSDDDLVQLIADFVGNQQLK